MSRRWTRKLITTITTVEPVYSGHPGDTKSGFSITATSGVGDLLAYMLYTPLRTLPPGCYREVTCLYSDRYIQVPLYYSLIPGLMNGIHMFIMITQYML